MMEPYREVRGSTRQAPPRFGQRQRLEDITARVVNQNVNWTPPAIHQKKSLSPGSKVCQQEARYLSDDVQHAASIHTTQPIAIENKRLSAITDSKRNSKRDSYSSASTNTSAEGRRRKSRVGPWLLGPTLGHGATGRVRKAKHAITGGEAAIKIVSRYVAQDMRSESVAVMDDLLAKDPRWASETRVPFSIEREVLIMKLIQHPNIIQLYDVWENRGEMYLVLEYVANGELFSYILDRGRLTEAEAIRIFRQIMSGLEHCHFFKLCHRDLKPENILLDTDYNVKIVDFGMSSIQHSGWMHTSCGSPHYAAPEVIRGGRYNGEKADIWSAGVVLYVMLVGRAPFAPELDTNNPQTRDMHLREILQQVCAAEVLLPHWISDEAEDLILRILDPDPVKRITIAEIWAHPLLQKYESLALRQGWLGGSLLTVTNVECGGPLRDSEIDMDIVSSLCMLWHTTSEKGIMQQLRSSEPNFERLLYHRLLKSRREQEENFHGAGVETSSSDYHHVGKHRQLRRSTTRASSIVCNRKGLHSQYSIASGNKRRPSDRSANTVSETETNKSYDPFRASRDQILSTDAEAAKVTLLRGTSTTTSSARGSCRAQHPALTRIRDEASPKFNSSPPVSWPKDANGNFRTLRHTDPLIACHSKSSFASSTRSAKSSRFKRSSASYKRGVSFSQLRRRSNSSHGIPIRPRGPSPSQMKRPRIHGAYSFSESLTASLSHANSISSAIPVVAGKETSFNTSRSPGKVQSNRFSVLLREEARQLSRELEQYCDDAFRDSLTNLETAAPSSQVLSHPTAAEFFDLPPFAVPPPRKSSINQSGRLSVPLHGDRYRHRPLPEPPHTPVLETAALQKLRRFHEARSTILRSADFLPPDTLNEAIASVDKLIQKAQVEFDKEQGFRIVSTPINGSQLGHRKINDAPRGDLRYVSEPTHSVNDIQRQGTDRNWSRAGTTIRIVNGSKETSQTNMHNEPRTEEFNLQNKRYNGVIQPHIHTDRAFAVQFREVGLGAIEEEKEARESNNTDRMPKENMFKNWFRRSASSAQSSESERRPTPPEKDPPEHGYRMSQLDPRCIQSFGNSIDADIEPRGASSLAVKKRSGWLGFLSKRAAQKAEKNRMMVLDDSEDDSIARSSATSHAEAQNRRLINLRPEDEPPAPQTSRKGTSLLRRANAPTQNWIARFLRVSPAKRVVALQMKRMAALKEIRGVLRDWKRHGMRDVITDRASGKLWARVDIENSLHIKPVSIRIEFYTVLLHGRKHGLSLGRFVQESGAKSSFQKVVKTMESVLRGRGLLVAEKAKAKKMRRCLKEWDRM